MIREARHHGEHFSRHSLFYSRAVAVALRVAVSDVGEERPPVSFESSLDVTLSKSRSHHRSMIAQNNRRSEARKSD